MKAARLEAPGRVNIVEVERPALEAGDILVRVLACGVCGSDQHAWRGVVGLAYPLPPGAPGHEVWGEVAALGPGLDDGCFEIGQPVTGLMYGGYADYVVAPAEQLTAGPPSYGGDVLLGEPLACAANAARRARHQPGERVAFVGFGYLAALIALLLFPERQGDWVAVTRRAESRNLALRLGAAASYGFDALPDDLWDSVPLVIEAAGVQQTLDLATWLTAYGGRLVIAGYHADGPRTINMQSWNWKGIDVVNAHERRPEAYLRGLREGLALVERYRLDLAALITHRWPLAQLDQALRTAAERPPGFVKGVVLPWSR